MLCVLMQMFCFCFENIQCIWRICLMYVINDNFTIYTALMWFTKFIFVFQFLLLKPFVIYISISVITPQIYTISRRWLKTGLSFCLLLLTGAVCCGYCLCCVRLHGQTMGTGNFFTLPGTPTNRFDNQTDGTVVF